MLLLIASWLWWLECVRVASALGRMLPQEKQQRRPAPATLNEVEFSAKKPRIRCQGEAALAYQFSSLHVLL
jgi:hypothetical protein